jgi:hypothetical protein
MDDIVDITPSPGFTFEQRRDARLSLSKSRFFLLLALGAQFGSEENPIPTPFCTCSNPRFEHRVVHVTHEKTTRYRDMQARALIELKGRQSAKTRRAIAKKIASAIEGLFSHVHHSHFEFTPHQIPKEFIKRGEVNVGLVEELEALTDGDIYLDRIRERLLSSVIIAPSSLAMIFYLLPFVLQNEDLFNACMFFRSSCSEFCFMDGVVSDVLYEPKREPENESERLALEHLVLQSFRTVEAIVGEPGKHEKRFRERLKTWGFDWNERVGFRRHKRNRLEDRIRWLQGARDSAAAHGKRRRRNPFTHYEAMEAQHLADSVLHRALWHTAEKLGREGDEAEIAFLLEEMFPNYPGWARDKKLFGGKRAVDLARIPEGLKLVSMYQERRVRAVVG